MCRFVQRRTPKPGGGVMPAADTITILHSLDKLQAKTIEIGPSGELRQKPGQKLNAYMFRGEERAVSNLPELAAILDDTSENVFACIVRARIVERRAFADAAAEE